MLAAEQLPFPRGSYWELTAADGDIFEGKEFWCEDRSYSTVGAPYRSRRLVKVRVVRNASGVALPPKRLVVLGRDSTKNVAGTTATAGSAGTTEVTGIHRADTAIAGGGPQSFPVDEFVASTGVPNGALFYIVVQGPAICLTGIADRTADIAVGDVLHSALTAATSAVTNGITTGGRLGEVLTVASTDVTAAMIVNRLGRALSAAVTNSTNADVLVDVGA